MNEPVKSTCCYCGVGCGLLIDTDEGTISSVRGDPDHPANAGRLCTKGASLHLTTRPDYRVLHPNCGGSARCRACGWPGTTRWTSPPSALPRSSPRTVRIASPSTCRASC
jgi:anaerobic selenocysteine-containing dehydrogenase